jgi:hypothetical protein
LVSENAQVVPGANSGGRVKAILMISDGRQARNGFAANARTNRGVVT